MYTRGSACSVATGRLSILLLSLPLRQGLTEPRASLAVSKPQWSSCLPPHSTGATKRWIAFNLGAGQSNSGPLFSIEIILTQWASPDLYNIQIFSCMNRSLELQQRIIVLHSFLSEVRWAVWVCYTHSSGVSTESWRKLFQCYVVSGCGYHYVLSISPSLQIDRDVLL